MRYIYNLEQAESRSHVGGKAYGLHNLNKWGVRIPESFVISTDAYKEMVDPIIHRKKKGEISDTIQQLDLNSMLTNELHHSWKQLIEPYTNHFLIACRSSATIEDSQTASFAGQFETVLEVNGFDEMLVAIKKCWASAWSQESETYRSFQGIDQKNNLMGVIVQRMLRAETSGIVFTANPVSGNDQELVINSVQGPGHYLASGLTIPDTFTMRKSNLEILSRIISTDHPLDTEIKLKGSLGGTKETYSTNNRPTLMDKELKQIAKLAIYLEEQSRFPQDIEWAYENGLLFALQSRNITTL